VVHALWLQGTGSILMNSAVRPFSEKPINSEDAKNDSQTLPTFSGERFFLGSRRMCTLPRYPTASRRVPRPFSPDTCKDWFYGHEV